MTPPDPKKPPRGRPPQARHKRPHDTAPGGFASALPGDKALIYGIHSVRAALDNPARKPHRLIATRNALARLEVDPDAAHPFEVVLESPGAIDRLLPADAVHQGALLEADPLAVLGIEDLEDAHLIVVLDQVTDPQNVGAVLRSCAAFAADALVMTHRHSPSQTGALAKAASGALEHVPVVAVGNLARALDALGQMGFHRLGLDSEASHEVETVMAADRLAIVLGAEGKGLRLLTRQTCDAMARLDMPGAIRSLNVSNAAALSLYAATRVRR